MSTLRFGLTMIGAIGLATSANAETFDLGFANLPTAQGWTYNANGPGALAETAFYTVTGTRLLQQTEGFPAGTNDGYYARAVNFVGSTDFTLSATASITSSTGALGFILGLDSAYFGLGSSNLGVYSAGEGLRFFDLPVGFDATSDTDFLVTRIGNTVKLTAGGNLLFDGVLTGFNTADRVVIGDGTKFADATGTYSALRFTSGAVPEPGSWAMMIAGFGLTGAVARRRRVISA